jgi:predicted nicotinamide N-methyase
MHHVKHPLRLKFDAAAASSSAVAAHVDVLPLYSATIVVTGPDATGGRGSEALSAQRGRFPTQQSFCTSSSFATQFAPRHLLHLTLLADASPELCSEAGDNWGCCSDGSAPGWRCVGFQGNSLFFQESPSHARECTGAVVWDGALMLLDVFAPLARSFAGKNVVDLGCGTGIVGIALASIGARVWLTDIGVGVDIARCNTTANNKVISDHSGRVMCQQLDWSDSQSSLTAFPSGSAVDAIIACEVVYNNDAFAPLLRVLLSLSSKATFIYLVLRQRHGCDTAAFVRDARAHFAVEEMSLPVSWREKCGGAGGDAAALPDQRTGLKHALKMYTLRRLK